MWVRYMRTWDIDQSKIVLFEIRFFSFGVCLCVCVCVNWQFSWHSGTCTQTYKPNVYNEFEKNENKKKKNSNSNSTDQIYYSNKFHSFIDNNKIKNQILN